MNPEENNYEELKREYRLIQTEIDVLIEQKAAIKEILHSKRQRDAFLIAQLVSVEEKKIPYLYTIRYRDSVFGSDTPKRWDQFFTSFESAAEYAASNFGPGQWSVSGTPSRNNARVLCQMALEEQ
jgi:hypothetical protein